jgi:hypothetical protein
VQLLPLLSQSSHWYESAGFGPFEDHVPGVAVRTLPTTGFPVTVGGERLTIGGGSARTALLTEGPREVIGRARVSKLTFRARCGKFVRASCARGLTTSA